MKRSSSASFSSCSSSPASSSSSSFSPVEFQNPDQAGDGSRGSNNKRARRVNNNNNTINNKGNLKKSQKPKSIRSSSSAAISGGRRSSVYRGVTRHRWTGRFEAHLWDKSSWNSLQNKKGRQVYLGAYDNEEAAARTYDLAALKYWGRDTALNFPIETYTKDLEEIEKVTKEEYLASLRRQSSGFSRGVSKYRGVARHHHNGRWEARIGRVLGNKYLYLGTYSTQEEAAMAYDRAALQYRGANAVTNFDISNYVKINKKKKKNEQSQEETVITVTSSQEEANPNSSSSCFESENPQKQQEHQEIEIKPENPNVQPAQIPQPSEESSLVPPKDPLAADEQDLPWIFMDDDGFSQFQVPDLHDGDLLNIFHDGGGKFEEDINFLFRSEPEAGDFNLDAILNSPSYGDLVMGDSTTIKVGDDDCTATPPSASPNSSISSSGYTHDRPEVGGSASIC